MDASKGHQTCIDIIETSETMQREKQQHPTNHHHRHEATSSSPSANNDNTPAFPFAGIAAQMLASVLFSLSVLCIKLLHQIDGGLVDKTRAMYFRGLFLAALSGFSMLCKGQKFPLERPEVPIVFARCSFAFLGIYGSYLSLEYINLGDSTAIVYSPLWTSVLGCLLLGEPFRWIQLFALPASVAGIVLIGHPTLITGLLWTDNQQQQQLQQTLVGVYGEGVDAIELDELSHEQYDFEHRWPGLALALASSLAVAFTYITFRVHSSTPIQTTTFWLGLTTCSCTLVIMTLFGFGSGCWPANPLYYMLMFCNAFFTWIGQALLQYALRHESASVLSVVRTLDVVVTFTLGALVLHEQVPTTSLVGASIIGLVVVSIVSSDICAKMLKDKEKNIKNNPDIIVNNDNNNNNNNNNKAAIYETMSVISLSTQSINSVNPRHHSRLQSSSD